MCRLLISCVALVTLVMSSSCGPKRGDTESQASNESRTTGDQFGSGSDVTTENPTDVASGADRPVPSTIRPAPQPEVKAPPATQNIVSVTDPDALAPIMAAGGDIGSLLTGARVDSNRALANAPRYRSIAKVLTRDVRAIERQDPKAGVGIRGNVHRLFDWRWLTSSEARYDLIGLVYRIDRIPTRTDGRCGDVHMIYRLSYTTTVSGESVTSRLPMTLVLFLPGIEQRDQSCAHAAHAWRAPKSLTGRALGEWMVSDRGPLGGRALTTERVERVRVNMQSVRWPSAVRPDLGGHAEYVLRSFVPDGDAMTPRPLENTPDIKRLRKNKKLRGQLATWIGDNLDAIDAGTAMIPTQFLAKRSDSVTPRGFSRRANRPFRQLFSPKDFAELKLSDRTFIRSPEALVRRLDDLTCAGCHQSRTIAGFHLLGKDSPDVAPGNALAVYMSTHLHDEINRRSRVLDQLADERPVDYTRPFAERGPSDHGQLGSRCGMGDPGFASWTCADGLICDAYDTPKDDRAVGTCMPADEMSVGGPCQFGPLNGNRDPHRDRTGNKGGRECASDAVCNSNRVGFPGGMCTASCDGLSNDGACGVIAELTPFNNCLARKTPFPKCLAEHVFPAGLRACDRHRPCRDDYICSLTPSGEGACIPPYFLFQMRVDGHP